jgi:tetratricopeptide (TPR) repeat protein
MKTLIPLALLLITLTASSDLSAQGEGWWDDLYEQRPVTLDQVLAEPHAYRNIDISFVVQFNSIGSIDNPYYTRFERDHYVNFSAWGDPAHLWRRSVYKASFPYLFMSRISKQSKDLLRANRYQRFVVAGRVASVFRGQPWIEVMGIKPLKGALTEPSLIHIVKANELKRIRRFDAAAGEFALADIPTLPVSVRTECLTQQAYCLSMANRYSDALRSLQQALALNPKDAALKKACVLCARKAKNPRRRARFVGAKKTKSKPATKPDSKKPTKTGGKGS